MGLQSQIESLVELSNYDQVKIHVKGTSFTILGRKSGGFGVNRIRKSVANYWPLFVKRLGNPVLEAAVIDFEADIGGGPMDRFIVGVYSSDSVSEEFQKVISDVLGFPPQGSTIDYIAASYSHFADPIQTYVDEMVSHELGHLYFGWGVLQVTGNKDLDNVWFHLGMGMVYDRDVWSESQKNPSPLLQAIVDRYLNHFSKISDLDGRLIGPDTSADSLIGLNRAQTICHGKAYLYLKELREMLGHGSFDRQIKQCFVSHAGKHFGYDDFVSTFSLEMKSKIDQFEKKWGVR